MGSRLRAWAVCALAWVLVGCGGGGGGGAPGGGIGGVATAAFAMPEGVVTQVAGHPLRVAIRATVTYLGTSDIYVALEESGGLVVDGSVRAAAGVVDAELTLGARAAGRYETQLRLRTCFDAACTQPAGPPALMTLWYEVTPNIEAPARIALERSGREPAPTARIPVVVPAGAGAVTMKIETVDRNNFGIVFDGNELAVSTRQERAGTYRARVTFENPSDTRYRASVDIDYTVHAPEGGERPLQLSDYRFELYLPQGATATRRFSLTRSTWTDALVAPAVTPSDPLCTVQPVGTDVYDIVVDTRGQAAGDHTCTVWVTEGPTGAGGGVEVIARVGAALSLQTPLYVTLEPSSTTADLRLHTAVLSADTTPQRWSARSLTPWLAVVTASGTTGVDELVVELDAAAVPTLGRSEAGQIEIGSDRPGTLPMVVNVGVGNLIPRLGYASAGALVGGRASLYFEGFVPEYYGSTLMSSGVIQVDGARLLDAVTPNDTRFFGRQSVLRVDVDQAQPGRDVTVRVAAPLSPTQKRFAVEAPTAVPDAYAALPTGRYRPVSYGSALDTAYFAGEGRVYRWRHAGGTWQLDSTALAGVIDVTLRPDEASLYATTGRDVVGLDPVSLAQTGRATLPVNPISPDGDFDLTPPDGLRALAYSADLRAFASKRGAGLASDRTGAAWLWAADAVDIASVIGWGGPGSGLYGPSSGSGLVRSVSGRALVSVYGPSSADLYLADTRVPVSMAGPFADARIAAVSDDGRRIVFADGSWRDGTAMQASLAGLLPSGLVADGFALDGAGSFAFVYTYRIVDEGGSDRARDAALWVIDLRATGAPGVVATLPLSDAVGCTAQRVSGEPCRHTGLVTIAEGTASAFVVGPHAIAALPLPAAVAAPLRAPRTGAAAARPPFRKTTTLTAPTPAR